MTDNGAIQVLYLDRDDDPDAKSFLTGHPAVAKVRDLDTETMADSIARLCAQLDRVFDRADATHGAFELSGVDVTVEITGTGEIRLIGSASLAVSGGITLSFTRKDHSAS